MKDEIEAAIYYIDDVLEQIDLIKNRNPTKADMYGHIDDWKQSLKVVNSLLKET